MPQDRSHWSGPGGRAHSGSGLIHIEGVGRIQADKGPWPPGRYTLATYADTQTGGDSVKGLVALCRHHNRRPGLHTGS